MHVQEMEINDLEKQLRTEIEERNMARKEVEHTEADMAQMLAAQQSPAVKKGGKSGKGAAAGSSGGKKTTALQMEKCTVLTPLRPGLGHVRGVCTDATMWLGRIAAVKLGARPKTAPQGKSRAK